MKEIRIKESLKRQLMMIIIAIIMLLGSSSLLLIVDFDDGRRIILRIIGIVGVIFFALFFIFIIKRLIKPIDILVINDKGIEDNSSAISLGFTPWDTIEDVYIAHVGTQKFICLNINNINERLNEVSFLKRISIKSNLLSGYSPILISLNLTKYKYEDIIQIIERYRKENKLRNI